MKRMAMDLNKSEALARKKGFRIAAPDDPIYSDGPSIILSSHTRKPSAQNDVVSLPVEPPEE